MAEDLPAAACSTHAGREHRRAALFNRGAERDDPRARAARGDGVEQRETHAQLIDAHAGSSRRGGARREARRGDGAGGAVRRRGRGAQRTWGDAAAARFLSPLFDNHALLSIRFLVARTDNEGRDQMRRPFGEGLVRSYRQSRRALVKTLCGGGTTTIECFSCATPTRTTGG